MTSGAMVAEEAREASLHVHVEQRRRAKDRGLHAAPDGAGHTLIPDRVTHVVRLGEQHDGLVVEQARVALAALDGQRASPVLGALASRRWVLEEPEPAVLSGGTHDAEARVDDDVVHEHAKGGEAILANDASRAVDVALHARSRLLEARGGEG